MDYQTTGVVVFFCMAKTPRTDEPTSGELLSFDSRETSSNIAAAQYNCETEQLLVTFKHGGRGESTYAYERFPRHAWDEFDAAQSKGRHFQQLIKPFYVGRKLS